MEDKEYSWEDTVEVNDDELFNSPVLLDEGDYTFTVTKFEREISKSSGRNMATFTVTIDSEKGSTEIKDYFPITQSVIWKLQRFTLAIGIRQHNEPVAFSKLNQAIGKTGRCKVVVEKFQNKRGGTGKCNKIDSYYDKAEPTQPTPVEQASQATAPWLS